MLFIHHDAKDAIPTPYDLHGCGDTFFITYRENVASKISECLPAAPEFLKLNFDPRTSSSVSKLHGLDLFCARGSLGRGLEGGGAVQTEWAVEMDTAAIYTYRTNLQHPNSVKLFHSSVDVFLSMAIDRNSLVPKMGDIDIIYGGPPCQSFSRMRGRADTVPKGI